MKRIPLITRFPRAVPMTTVVAAAGLVMVSHAQPVSRSGKDIPAASAPSAVAAPPETAGISARVALIVGKVPESRATPSERLAALRRLSDAIPASDASVLLDFAAGPAPGDFPAPVWHAVVNDTFDLLLRLKTPPAGLGRDLIRVTDSADQVLNDYALQKLDKLAARPLSLEFRQEIAAALAKASAIHGSPAQGTALLTWRRLTEAFPSEYSPDAFHKALTACLKSPAATPAAQTAALSAAAAASLPETAPAARVLLVQPGASVSLRISALHALGATGGKEDIPLISQYLPVLGCEAAAAAALQKL